MLTQHLIVPRQEKNSPETEFHYDNMVYTVLNLFFAGTETTSTTIRYALMLLIKYTKIQGMAPNLMSFTSPLAFTAQIYQGNIRNAAIATSQKTLDRVEIRDLCGVLTARTQSILLKSDFNK